MELPYKMIDHTGDAGAVIYGKSWEELFANAAIAMLDLLVDREAVQPKFSRDIELDGEDIEDLLVRWLSELNYYVSANREVYTSFEIEHISDKHLCASAKGEMFDPSRHEMRAEIKAVTYHELSIKKTGSGFEAQVIFDL